MSFNDLLTRILFRIPLYRKTFETKRTQTPITFQMWFVQKVLGFNKEAYWPVHHSSLIQGVENICIGVETSPGYMPGCYLQASDKIVIGDYTQIGPNVGILSSNHDLHDNRINISKGSIEIGEYSWLGMGCRIMPGVKLGPHTVVGANAVVTKSFPDGYVVLAGNPAIEIKKLEKDKCVKHKSKIEYIGYIPKEKFESFKKQKLNFN